MASQSSHPILLRPLRWLKLALPVLLLLLGLGWAGVRIHHHLNHVSVQDARVMASLIVVSSRVDGRVTDFGLTEGDRLKKDDPVASLYRLPDERRLKTLQAGVAAMQAKLDVELARQALGRKQFQGGLEITRRELAASKAAEAASRARFVQAQKNYQRSEALFGKGSVSQQRRDQDYYRYKAAEADYRQARRQVAVSQVQVDNARIGFLNGVQVPLPPPPLITAQLKVAREQLQQAKDRLEQQKVRLHDLRIRSPIDGRVDKTLIDPGEYLSAGQPILIMHDPTRLWVEANVKETDIARLRLGQPVDIDVDAYPDRHFSGQVRIIGRAATSQFALLPDPNPSGNFTKITQRIPVRISLDHGPIDLLGPGMMVEVEIDVRRHTEE